MPNKFQTAISEIARARKRIKTARKTLDKSDAVLNKSSKLLRQKGVRPYRKRTIPVTAIQSQKDVANLH